MRSLLIMGAALAWSTLASAALIAVGDETGHVGIYNTVLNAATPLGAIPGFSGQVLGLAYDPGENTVLLMSRGANGGVYAMNGTGNTSLRFATSSGFQGGAVSGGVLYGTQENGVGQTPVAGYQLASGNLTVSGAVSPDHTHAMGVNLGSGQVYASTVSGVIRGVNGDGTYGSIIVTALGLREDADDMDYYLGDFLVTAYARREVWLVNGATGVSSLFLNAAQMDAMGLTGSTSGIAVLDEGFTNVPEPGTMALMGAGLLGAMAVRRRRGSA